MLAWDNGPTNIYYSFTRGFKAGGFPEPYLFPIAPVQPEKIFSHEVGIKQSMLDNRFRLNASSVSILRAYPTAPGATLCLCAMDVTGTPPSFAPEWTGSFNANYQFAIGNWTASLSGIAQYRSSIKFQPGSGGQLGYDRVTLSSPWHWSDSSH